MKQFTQEQINNFKAYLKVQKRGKYNMFDPMAVGATGLTPTEYGFVMDNYGELALSEENQKVVKCTDIRIEYSARESIYVFRAEWIENGIVVGYGNWKDGKSTYSETREIAIKCYGDVKVTTSH